MTAQRVMGIETEYGVTVPGDALANPMVTSAQIVNGYASSTPGYRQAALGLRGGEPTPRRTRL